MSLSGVTLLMVAASVVITKETAAEKGMSGWNTDLSTQYHIQTDEGDERYFRYQTIGGQYRKEKRLQDGTVVGTYGWVDPNGFLRLRDYVADNSGYKVVRSKIVFVGKDSDSRSDLERNSVSSVTSPPAPSTVPLPSSPSPYGLPEISSNDLPQQSPVSFLKNPSSQPITNTFLYTSNNPSFSIGSDRRFGNNVNGDFNSLEASASIQNYQKYNLPQEQQQYPLYDGIAATHNGFRYYLPQHYHEEENSGSDTRAGSFGYIDPFGIRRIIYYNTAPDTGFTHRKNNRYVGFGSPPYDPRF